MIQIIQKFRIISIRYAFEKSFIRTSHKPKALVNEVNILVLKMSYLLFAFFNLTEMFWAFSPKSK